MTKAIFSIFIALLISSFSFGQADKQRFEIGVGLPEIFPLSYSYAFNDKYDLGTSFFVAPASSFLTYVVGITQNLGLTMSKRYELKTLYIGTNFSYGQRKTDKGNTQYLNFGIYTGRFFYFSEHMGLNTHIGLGIPVKLYRKVQENASFSDRGWPLNTTPLHFRTTFFYRF